MPEDEQKKQECVDSQNVGNLETVTRGRDNRRQSCRYMTVTEHPREGDNDSRVLGLQEQLHPSREWR
ncbi:hypothetical protein J6590_086548 [Homalodisca vitripennis]|nr:hypothetical protein J6590_086548 [Homalodisca vitripennis]